MTIKMKPLAQACAFALAAGSLTLGSSIAAPTLAGSTISNKVTVTYQDANGNSFTGESNVIEMTIREVRSSTLVSGNGATQAVDMTSTEIRSVHSLKNTGNIEETYTLAASNATDDTIDGTMMIYLDADGSGDLSQAEIDAGAITSLTLASDASASFIVVTTLPAAITATDTLHVQLTATDAANNVAADVNDVSITFVDNTPVRVVVTQPEGLGSMCHSYEWVQGQPGISWENAKIAAEGLSYNGKPGYLATLVTQTEDQFVLNSVINGASSLTGTTLPWFGMKGEQWITGEPTAYLNWSPVTGNNGSVGRNFVTHPYALYETDGTWAIWNTDAAPFINGFIVEYDTACAQPQVSVALTAAKDVACDGTADDAFGDVNLADMASGECVIMHMRGENTSNVAANNITFKQIVPANTTYVPDTIGVCGFAEPCTLVHRSDSLDKDTSTADWGHYDTNTGTVEIGGYFQGSLAPMPAAGILHAEYRLKID